MGLEALRALHRLLAPALLFVAAEYVPAAPVQGQVEPRFQRDVRPLLAARCFPCHGPDAGAREAKLRLDTAEGPEGAYRSRFDAQAIRPGSLAESELWYRVTSDDEDERMPPPESDLPALEPEELELLGRWIEGGALYEDHWAFVAPTPPRLAPVEDEGWIRQPLDRFVLRDLERAARRPSPRADARTLIRRLSFDLTGLPPTRDEIRAFLEDDSAQAYERLVDGLLARPQYGEHRARYWLDLVRFADTNGVHHDHYREMSRYRDWVIRAWNANLPYDRFIADQIAGDLYPEPSDEQLTASGFNRLHLIIDRGTMLPEESLTRNVIDRVTAVGTAFMGLTVQCAVCHDHKYDPLTQKDFYQLYAFFNNLDAEPETGPRSGADFRRGLQPPYISFPTEEQNASLAALAGEQQALERKIERLTREASEPREPGEPGEDEARSQALQSALEQCRAALAAAKQQAEEIQIAVTAAMVMKERSEVRPAHILIRGAYDKPGALVERDTPGFLPPLVRAQDRASRMDLARWLVAPENPLTARVAVNQLWQQLFGVGLVKTSEDFGIQGAWPSHVELLDHLACAFVESGWDVKALLRKIVLSATYQQSSVATAERFEADPENRQLARGSRYRLDAEVIRDQILATSGLLHPKLYGPSVKPPQPAGIWKAVSLPDSYPRTFVADQGDAIHRRSLYTFWKRGLPPPQMSILNAPSRESCTARRERTNTPLQALLLLNEEQYLGAARHLAHTTLTSAELTPTQRVELLYETITSQLPGPATRAILLESVRDLEALYAGNEELAQALCDRLVADTEAVSLAAWTVLVNALYNLDVTKTRE